MALAIDHVTVAGSDLRSDLSAMRARLQSVGIRSEYGGPHSNRATEMALTSFPDGSYLELIAISSGADETAVAAHAWSRQLRGARQTPGNAGPCAWAVRAQDLAQEIARLKKCGVIVSEPVRAGRERPDGVRLEWETAQVGIEPMGTFFPFLIHDVTPREKRAMPSGKPTPRDTTQDRGQDFAGVSRVVIAVRDLAVSAARYRNAYGLLAPAEQTDEAFGAKLAVFQGTPVILAEALDQKSWLAARLRDFGEGPCGFILRCSKPAAGAAVTWFDSAKLGWRLGFE